MIKQIVTLITLLTLGLTAMAQNESESTETIMHIAPYQQDCTGIGLQDCLIVRYEGEEDLSFFFDSIAGFEFEEGFEYSLLVNITERENVPADASSLQYDLVEVLQQYPAILDNKVWELQSLNGMDIEDPSQYTLLFTDDSVSIKADCNMVGADLTVNPFNIETTFTTLVLCAEGSLESDFLVALNAVTMMTVENGELILQSTDGQLRFVPPVIDDIEWTVTQVTYDDMMIDLDGSELYTLQINGDRVQMTLACNNGMGNVTLQGAVLEFTEIASTRAFCQDNPLDGIYPPESVIYSVNGDGNLILEDSMGNIYNLTALTTE